MSESFEITISHKFGEFTKEEWNLLVLPDSVFQEYEFLFGLEKTGCIGDSDWTPVLVSARRRGVLSGILPAYVRSDSYGEYIFDFQWANAFHRAGIPYYPKLTVAVPFTPVTGSRILLHPNLTAEEKVFLSSELLQRLLQFGKQEETSSVHLLFCKEEEQKIGIANSFAPRLSHQYHWFNKGFASFEEFLATLVKDRRKTIRQERRKISESGLTIQTLTGDGITEDHAHIFYEFYKDTHSKKWGQPYLNRQFFLEMYQTFRHRLLLVLASDPSGKPIGGSWNVFRDGFLFGRYWGALEHVPNLHFECCYYRLIDYAIEHKMERVEAGAQGEHKFLRGYEAVPMYSLHHIYNEQGRAAIESYLEREIVMERENISAYNAQSPIKALREG
ncbi:GNAT family N-acetyltransferase [Leptospira vanthielii]|uniref:PF04339 family protein n=1 Tax=Leptospira vanthielii serovar Holland str. Waz Holland = ATCC 700522 TaxID=1218591 RepID=N1W8G2_9LEPT|nr:GNAT family N-acetyltransferase [Leptospira vanthielii]EMY69740.1 PF04339 family protein [Leptospira vanthielii serovar Holland str. Waz Holland = ATCC 700522]